MKNKNLWNVVLVLCTLLWGSIHPVSKHVLNSGGDPFLLAFLRFFIALIPLIPFFLLELPKREKPGFKDIAVLSGLGFVGVGGFSLLMFLGLARTNASSSSILINTQPLFAAVFAAVLIREKLTVRHMIGIIVGLIGVSFVATRGDFSVLALRNEYFLGNLLCTSAAICISIFYIGLKKYVIRFGSIIPTFITSAAGSAVLLIPAFIAGAPFRSLLEVGWKEWLFILYIAIIATAFTFVLFHQAMSLIGVIRSTGFKFLVPVFGVILSIIFLGERLNLFVIIGILIVMAAIATIQLPGKKQVGSRE